jgi:hypothetical protein
MSLKGRSCWVVNIRMVRAEELSLEAIGRFVAASEDIRFEAQDRQQLYGWEEQLLSVFAFAVDFAAPFIPRFSAEWVGRQWNLGLHNFRKRSSRTALHPTGQGHAGRGAWCGATSKR